MAILVGGKRDMMNWPGYKMMNSICYTTITLRIAPRTDLGYLL
jgi:hypothetical protein